VRIVVSGSIAFDYLMHFPGRFKEHILPENLDSLSVSFLVDEMRRGYGGCGPNIAYSLALLGERPLLVGSAGSDFGDYRAWLEGNGVDTSNVLIVPHKYTASFFVSTDDAASQIATFYIGAMEEADKVALGDVGVAEGDIVIVSPDKPAAMLRHAEEAKALGARLIFDPSQQIPRLTGSELGQAAHGAFALTLNEYEYALYKDKTGQTDERIRAEVEVLVVTRGERGSDICRRGEEHSVPSATARATGDPTGVGDAYRAGLIKGLAAGLSLPTCGRIGSLAACFVVEQTGTQEHRFTPDEFIARYEQSFGDSMAIAQVVGVAIGDWWRVTSDGPSATID